MVKNGWISLFLMDGNSPLHTYTAFSLKVYLLMDTGCFCILAIVNNASINMGIRISSEYLDFHFLEYINTMPKKKKCKKAKWLSQEASQIAEKRREAKGKGEKERYIH